MAGGGMLRSSVRVSQARSPLAGVSHYAEKPLHISPVKIPKVSGPKAPSTKMPAAPAPKLSATGGLGMPAYGKAPNLSSPAPHVGKQITPRITVMRRDLVPAQRPEKMTSQDAIGGIQ